MSISNIRSASEKKGCQILLVVLGALLALGMVFTSFQFGGAGQGNGEQGPTALVVEGEAISFSEVDSAADQFASSQSMYGYTLDRTVPMLDFQALAGGLTQIISSRALRQMAAESNLSLTDEELLSEIREQVEASVTQMKLQLQLTEGIKEEDVEQEFTKRAGKSAQQLIADQMAQVEENIKDPAQRHQIELSFLSQKLQEKYAEQVEFNEDDLKKSYDNYVFQEVGFDSSTLPLDELRAEAEKAREELVNGADPVAVRQKYSPNSGRKDPLELTYDMMDGNPNFEGLINLQPGEVSEVIDPLGFPAVFKLKEIKNELPEGFEDNKANLIQNRKLQMAQAEFEKDVSDRTEALNIDWKDKGLEMIWDVRTAMIDPDLSLGDELNSTLQDLYAQSQALPADQTSPQYQSLASFIVAENLLSVADPATKEEAVERWATEVGVILSYYDSVPFRLALYEGFNREGMAEEAFIHLREAASMNIGGYEEEGQGFYTRINTTVAAARADKTFTEEQLATIDELLSAWTEGKAEYDEDLADLMNPTDGTEETGDGTTPPSDSTTGDTAGTEATTGSSPAPEGE